MNILIDTNIIFNILKADDIADIINFINSDKGTIYLSVVSEAEIKSLALRNKWGAARRNKLDRILDQLNIVDIDQQYINTYAEIDSFSQRLNPNFEIYKFDTPRNMGKNDLWIASLAALLGLKLITTDSDFDHLHNVFFEVQRLKPADFTPFF